MHCLTKVPSTGTGSSGIRAPGDTTKVLQDVHLLQPLCWRLLESSRCCHHTAVQITLTRDALEHIAALNHPLRRVVGARLSNLADGNWRLQPPQQQQQQSAVPPPAATVRHDLAARAAERRQLHSSAYGSQDSFQNLMVRLAGVRVYSMSFLAVGRVVFEVAPDYCERCGCYEAVCACWCHELL